MAKVLVENFGIAGITDVENDMKIFGIEPKSLATDKSLSLRLAYALAQKVIGL